MSNYHELDVWKQGRRLTASAYEFAALLPANEKFGLVSQIQRSAVSVPSNIAEGAGRGTDASFLQFVRIAIGSLNELETLVLLSVDVGLARDSASEPLLAEIKDLAIRLRNFAQRLGEPADRKGTRISN